MANPTTIPPHQQLAPCLDESDAYTLIAQGSVTLSTVTFSFNDLTTAVTFKNASPRIFAQTTLQVAAQFGPASTNADQAFAAIVAAYPECLLEEDLFQVCPLLTEGGEFIFSGGP